jgi:hypothetical protein
MSDAAVVDRIVTPAPQHFYDTMGKLGVDNSLSKALGDSPLTDVEWDVLCEQLLASLSNDDEDDTDILTRADADA